MQSTVENTVVTPENQRLSHLIDAYDSELCARREQLRSDLAGYQSRLNELQQVDPGDRAGLQRLYATHVCEIEKLLAESLIH